MAATLALLLIALGGPGCDSRARYRLLSSLVDGVPSYDEWMNPKPPERRARRPVRKPPPKLEPPPKVQVRVDLPQGTAGFPATWEALNEALPLDDMGDIDWTRAVVEGLIAPTNTIPPEPAAEQEIMPLDIEIRADDPVAKVVFPHEGHTRWLGCDSCHPEVFPMETSETLTDMEAINNGESCGLCHNTVAFPATTCGRCHPGMAG